MQNNLLTVNVYTDGGARGNPGRAAIGAVIEIQKGPDAKKETVKISRYIGFATNNQAEYQAVAEAIGEVIKIAGKSDGVVNFYLDSLLVVSQLNGKYKIKDDLLKKQYLNIMRLLGQLKCTCKFFHIRREANYPADRLVNEALDRSY
jgi:ribonuclease HI